MAAHTPAPWKVFKAGNQIGVVPVNKAGKPRKGRETPDICQMSIYDDDADANAQLIAAAPDLLEALKAIVVAARIDAPKNNAWQTLIADCAAAIAKTTGE